MPATDQARTLHDQSVQGFEEARRAYLAKVTNANEALAAINRGEIDGPDGRKWAEIFDLAHADAEALAARAAAMQKTIGTLDTLSRADIPDYLRPRGSDGAVLPPLNGDRDMLATTGERTAKLTGRIRAHANAAMRKPGNGGGLAYFAQLAAAERDMLGAPRKIVLGGVPSDQMVAPIDAALSTPYFDTHGGWITAVELRQEVIEYRHNLPVVSGRVQTIPTSAASVQMFTFRVKTQKGQARAGEATAITRLTAVLGKTQWTPAKHTLIIAMPDELQDDAELDILSMVTRSIARNGDDQREYYLILGNGNGQPLGVVTALNRLIAGGYAGIAVPHTGASGTTAFKANDIKGFPLSMRAIFRNSPGAAWLMNRQTILTVSLMRTEEGGAGTGEYLFQRGLSAGNPNTLGSYGLLESEYFPAVASGAGNPVALFGDWETYVVFERRATRLRILQELYAETGEIGYLWDERYDGTMTDAEAFIMLVNPA